MELPSLEKREVAEKHKGAIWHQYFAAAKKDKDPTLTEILDNKTRYYKLYYPFLLMAQIMGKVYDELEIPHSFGVVDRWRLRRLYQNAIKSGNSLIGKFKVRRRSLPRLPLEIKKSCPQTIIRSIPTSLKHKRLSENEKITTSYKRRKTVTFEEDIKIYDISPNMTRNSLPITANRFGIKKTSVSNSTHSNEGIQFSQPVKKSLSAINDIPDKETIDPKTKFLLSLSLSKNALLSSSPEIDFKTSQAEITLDGSHDSDSHNESEAPQIPKKNISEANIQNSSNSIQCFETNFESNVAEKDNSEVDVDIVDYSCSQEDTDPKSLINSDSGSTQNLENTVTHDVGPLNKIIAGKNQEKKAFQRKKSTLAKTLRERKCLRNQFAKTTEEKEVIGFDKEEIDAFELTADNQLCEISSSDVFDANTNSLENIIITESNSLPDFVHSSETTYNPVSVEEKPLSYSTISQNSEDQKTLISEHENECHTTSRDIFPNSSDDFFSSDSEEELMVMPSTKAKDLSSLLETPELVLKCSSTKEIENPDNYFSSITNEEQSLTKDLLPEVDTNQVEIRNNSAIVTEKYDTFFSSDDEYESSVESFSLNNNATPEEYKSQFDQQDGHSNEKVILPHNLKISRIALCRHSDSSSAHSSLESLYGLPDNKDSNFKCDESPSNSVMIDSSQLNNSLEEAASKLKIQDDGILSSVVTNYEPKTPRKSSVVSLEISNEGKMPFVNSPLNMDYNEIGNKASYYEDTSEVKEDHKLTEESLNDQDEAIDNIEIAEESYSSESDSNINKEDETIGNIEIEEESYSSESVSNINKEDEESLVEVSTSYETDPETGKLMTIRFIPKIKLEIKSEETSNQAEEYFSDVHNDDGSCSENEEYNEYHKIGMYSEGVNEVTTSQVDSLSKEMATSFNLDNYITPEIHSDTDNGSNSTENINRHSPGDNDDSNSLQTNKYGNSNNLINNPVINIKVENDLNMHDRSEENEINEAVINYSTDKGTLFPGIVSECNLTTNKSGQEESIIVSPDFPVRNNVLRQWLDLENKKGIRKQYERIVKSNSGCVSKSGGFINLSTGANIKNEKEEVFKKETTETPEILSSSCPITFETKEFCKEEFNKPLSYSEGLLDVNRHGVITLNRIHSLRSLQQRKETFTRLKGIDISKNIISASESNSPRREAREIKWNLNNIKSNNDVEATKKLYGKDSVISLNEKKILLGKNKNEDMPGSLISSTDNKVNFDLADISLQQNYHYEKNSFSSINQKTSSSPDMITSSSESQTYGHQKILNLENYVMSQNTSDETSRPRKLEFLKSRDCTKVKIEKVSPSEDTKVNVCDFQDNFIKVEKVSPTKQYLNLKDEFGHSCYTGEETEQKYKTSNMQEHPSSSSSKGFGNEGIPAINISDYSNVSSLNSDIDSSARKKKVRTDLRRQRAKMIKNRPRNPHHLSSSSPEDNSSYQRKHPKRLYKEILNKAPIMDKHQNIHSDFYESSSEVQPIINTSLHEGENNITEDNKPKKENDGGCNNISNLDKIRKSTSYKAPIYRTGLEEVYKASSIESIRQKSSLVVKKKSSSHKSVLNISNSENDFVEASQNILSNEQSNTVSWTKTISMREALNDEENMRNLSNYTKSDQFEAKHEESTHQFYHETSPGSENYVPEIRDLSSVVKQDITVNLGKQSYTVYSDKKSDCVEEFKIPEPKSHIANISNNLRYTTCSVSPNIKKQPLGKINLLEKNSSFDLFSRPIKPLSHSVKFKKTFNINRTDTIKHPLNSFSTSVSRMLVGDTVVKHFPNQNTQSPTVKSTTNSQEFNVTLSPVISDILSTVSLGEEIPKMLQMKADSPIGRKTHGSSTSEAALFSRDYQQKSPHSDSSSTITCTPYSEEATVNETSIKNEVCKLKAQNTKSSVVRSADKICEVDIAASPEVEILMRRAYFMEDGVL